MLLASAAVAHAGARGAMALLRKRKHEALRQRIAEASQQAAQHPAGQSIVSACEQLHNILHMPQQAECNEAACRHYRRSLASFEQALGHAGNCSPELAQMLVDIAHTWQGPLAEPEHAWARMLAARHETDLQARLRMLRSISTDSRAPLRTRAGEVWLGVQHSLALCYKGLRQTSDAASTALAAAKKVAAQLPEEVVQHAELELEAIFLCIQAATDDQTHMLDDALQRARCLTARIQMSMGVQPDVRVRAFTELLCLELLVENSSGVDDAAEWLAMETADAPVSIHVMHAHEALAQIAGSNCRFEQQARQARAGVAAWSRLSKAQQTASSMQGYTPSSLYCMGATALLHMGALQAAMQLKCLALAAAAGPGDGEKQAEALLVHAQVGAARGDDDAALQAARDVLAINRCSAHESRVARAIWLPAACLVQRLQGVDRRAQDANQIRHAMRVCEQIVRQPGSGVGLAQRQLEQALAAGELARARLVMCQPVRAVRYARIALCALEHVKRERRGKGLAMEADMHAALAQGLASLGSKAETLQHASIALARFAEQGRMQSREVHAVRHAMAQAVAAIRPGMSQRAQVCMTKCVCDVGTDTWLDRPR